MISQNSITVPRSANDPDDRDTVSRWTTLLLQHCQLSKPDLRSDVVVDFHRHVHNCRPIVLLELLSETGRQNTGSSVNSWALKLVDRRAGRGDWPGRRGCRNRPRVPLSPVGWTQRHGANIVSADTPREDQMPGGRFRTI